MPPVSEVESSSAAGSSAGLKRADCSCPVCLDIFLEPVTLPCTHTFCKPCFLETVDKSNMCCPLCRKRVSTWARLNSRNKTLVNMEFWRRIQDAFPVQCERRLQGIEDEDDVGMMIQRPRVCQPGELRREYEDQISKLVEEKRALEEAERRASEEYIQRLLAEEEERLAEERRRQEEKQLEDDERLARLISQELNSGPISESQWNVKPPDPASAKKKKPNSGDIEKFLRPVLHKQSNGSETSPNSSLMANKENIQNPPKSLSVQSMEETDELTSPVPDYLGKPSTSNSNPSCSAQTFTLNSPNSTSSKRKSSEIEDSETDLLNKRPCAAPPCDLSSADGPLSPDMGWYDEVLQSRWQQEEEDRRLAMRLQKELNREMAVDRRKGSADSYQLRQKTSPASTSSNSGASTPPTGKTPGKSPASSTSPPPPVSATPLTKGVKQTTLTEMFPNMSS